MSNGKAYEEKGTFRYAVGVVDEIEATLERVWALITDAAELVRWNTTIRSIDGDVAPGQRIALVAEIAPERTFKLSVAFAEPGSVMTWSDGFAPMFRGVRTYRVEPAGRAASGSRWRRSSRGSCSR